MQPSGTGVLADADALVRDIATVGAADLPTVGGKAANLGVLVGAGFRVPAAFCLSTVAYQQVARTRLRIGRLADLQHLRSTERLHEDGAHGGAR